MRRVVVGVVIGVVLVACKAGVGANGVKVEEQPSSVKVEASAQAQGKKGDGTKKGASNGPAPAGMSEAEAEAVCAAIRTPDCDKIEKCAPKTLLADYGDKATCVRRQIAECKAAFTLPGTKISLDQGKACGAKIAARGCDATDDMPECGFKGTIADGGPCISRDECASGYCEGGDASSCGKCKAAPAPKGGAAAGAACKADDDCNLWARCDGGKCVAAGKAKGAKCNQNDSCLYRLGLGCRGDVCGEVASVVETGGSCKPDAAAKTIPVCKGGRCDRGTNKCQALKAEGEPCKEGECLTDLVCDDKTKKCGPIKVDISVCWK